MFNYVLQIYYFNLLLFEYISWAMLIFQSSIHSFPYNISNMFPIFLTLVLYALSTKFDENMRANICRHYVGFNGYKLKHKMQLQQNRDEYCIKYEQRHIRLYKIEHHNDFLLIKTSWNTLNGLLFSKFSFLNIYSLKCSSHKTCIIQRKDKILFLRGFDKWIIWNWRVHHGPVVNQLLYLIWLPCADCEIKPNLHIVCPVLM